MGLADRCDVIVAGGGFGGLVAAAVAAQRGKRVVVFEAGDRLGGTVALSSGLMHMFDPPSWEAFRKAFPTIDEVLGRALFDAFPDFVTWLRSTVGVPMASVPLPSDPYGDTQRVPQGYLLGVGPRTAKFLKHLRGLSRLAYAVLGDWYLRALDKTVIRAVRLRVTESLSRALATSNGQVVSGARVENVTRDADGYCVEATTAAGTVRMRARVLVLATGGFQGNRELLTEHLGAGAAHIQCRAVFTNRGDGLRLGLALGGASQGPMGRFYGYPMAVLPKPIDHARDPIALLTCSAYYAGKAVLVDRSGKRFVDEAAAAKLSELAYAVASLAGGECWAVMDGSSRRQHGTKEFGGGLLPPIDLIQSAASRGAKMVVASTLEEMLTKLSEHGVDPQALRTTLMNFNHAVHNRSEAQLDPARSGGGPAVEVPPFFAVALVPGVSMTYGGLRVNDKAQALSAEGSPIDGLYAIPGAAGGLYHRQYGGALAACGAFGMIVGRGCP